MSHVSISVIALLAHCRGQLSYKSDALQKLVVHITVVLLQNNLEKISDFFASKHLFLQHTLT